VGAGEAGAAVGAYVGAGAAVASSGAVATGAVMAAGTGGGTRTHAVGMNRTANRMGRIRFIGHLLQTGIRTIIPDFARSVLSAS
jgi:hypothetical protein